MPQFENQLPELGIAPPSLNGQAQVPTKLHALRLRQLQDLAKAFGLEIPPGTDTKDELLLIMTQAEKRGVFRGTPVSQYHLLHAQISHDSKLTYEEKQDLDARLKTAEWNEFPPEGAAEKSLFHRLQQQCKTLGLNSMGKSVPEMRKMLKEANAETPE